MIPESVQWFLEKIMRHQNPDPRACRCLWIGRATRLVRSTLRNGDVDVLARSARARDCRGDDHGAPGGMRHARFPSPSPARDPPAGEVDRPQAGREGARTKAALSCKRPPSPTRPRERVASGGGSHVCARGKIDAFRRGAEQNGRAHRPTVISNAKVLPRITPDQNDPRSSPWSRPRRSRRRTSSSRPRRHRPPRRRAAGSASRRSGRRACRSI